MRRTLFAVVVAAALPASVGSAQTTAIVGGTIIDGTGRAPIANGVVVIADGKIVAVGDRSTPIPAAAARIPAEGKFLIPGLMDANVHLVVDASGVVLVRYEGRYDELAIEAAQVALKQGLTTVFDSWGPRAPLVKARDRIDTGQVPGARIYLAGNIVGFGGPFSDDFNPRGKETLYDEATTRYNAIWQENVGPELLFMAPDQVREEIRKYIARGVDFIKYPVTRHGSVEIMFSPRVQQVIVDEAHRAGKTVQTHTMSGEGVDLAVKAGVDLMQHCEVTLEQPMAAETVALVAERRVPCAFLPHTNRALAWYRQLGSSVPFFRHFAIDDVNERALLRAGAVVLLSSDAGVFGSNTTTSSFYRNNTPPDDNLLVLGEAHFVWLAAMEEKGMRPMDALLAATSNIARAYHVDRELGTLEPGKRADLVILDRDPLASAANYRGIHVVMKDGKVVDRDALPSRKLLTGER